MFRVPKKKFNLLGGVIRNETVRREPKNEQNVKKSLHVIQRFFRSRRHRHRRFE